MHRVVAAGSPAAVAMAVAVGCLSAGCAADEPPAAPVPSAEERAAAQRYLEAVAGGSADEVAAVTAYAVLSGDRDEVLGGTDLPRVCLTTELDAMAEVDPLAAVQYQSIGGSDLDGGMRVEAILMAFFPLEDGSSLGRRVGVHDERMVVFIEPSDACEEALAG